jgi:signal transduction histidine kinase
MRGYPSVSKDFKSLPKAQIEMMNNDKETSMLPEEISSMILENISDGVMLLSKDFRIIWANKKIIDTHSQKGKVIGDFCYRVTHRFKEPCQGPYDMCPVNAVLKNASPAHVMHTHFDKEGNEFYVEVSAYPLRDKEGKIINFIHISRDVTNLMKAKQAWSEAITEHKHGRKVEEAYQRLRLAQDQRIRTEKLSSLRKMAAGIVHQLNNPLTGLLSLAQMFFKKTEISDPNYNLIKSMYEAVGHMNEVVSNLSILSGHSKPELTKLNCNDVIISALGLSQQQLKEKKIRLILQLHKDLLPVNGNKDQLQRVVLNMVTHAGDAMPEGGIFTIRTNNSDDKSRVLIEFSDTGEGIPQKGLNHIFEPFFTTKGSSKGAGLGLSVSYSIIKNHRGDISVKSQAGKGTTFTVSLPVLAETGLAEFKKSKILVIDDDDFIFTTFREELEPKGFAVDSALDGKEALEKVKANRYDLIFIDLVIPQMDGIEICRSIKKINPHCVLISMTGYLDKESSSRELKFIEAGGRDYCLYKPFISGELLEVTQKALKELKTS